MYKDHDCYAALLIIPQGRTKGIARYPLTSYLEFSSSFGYAQVKQALSADYPYWNVGLTGRYKLVALDLRYHDAREIYFGSQAKSPDHPDTLKATVVFTISVGF